MSILQKVNRLAEQQLAEENKTPGGRDLEWCVYRAVSRLLTTQEFVELLDEIIGLTEFFDTPVTGGGTVRSRFAHKWIVDEVMNKLEKK